MSELLPGGVCCENVRNCQVPQQNIFCGHIFAAVVDEVNLEDQPSTFTAPPEHFCPTCQYSLEMVNWLVFCNIYFQKKILLSKINFESLYKNSKFLCPYIRF